MPPVVLAKNPGKYGVLRLSEAPGGFTHGEPFVLPTPVGTGDFLGLVLGAKGSPAPVRLEDAFSGQPAAPRPRLNREP